MYKSDDLTINHLLKHSDNDFQKLRLFATDKLLEDLFDSLKTKYLSNRVPTLNDLVLVVSLFERLDYVLKNKGN